MFTLLLRRRKFGEKSRARLVINTEKLGTRPIISSDNLRTERDVCDVDGEIVCVGDCDGVFDEDGVNDGVIVPVGDDPKLGDEDDDAVLVTVDVNEGV